jgi:hypothetical protein
MLLIFLRRDEHAQVIAHVRIPRIGETKLSVIYTALEEVEMHGFNGEDHELDFFRLILQCSPILKSVIVRPSHRCEGCATQLSNIFLAHPSVKYYWFR